MFIQPERNCLRKKIITNKWSFNGWEFERCAPPEITRYSIFSWSVWKRCIPIFMYYELRCAAFRIYVCTYTVQVHINWQARRTKEQKKRKPHEYKWYKIQFQICIHRLWLWRWTAPECTEKVPMFTYALEFNQFSFHSPNVFCLLGHRCNKNKTAPHSLDGTSFFVFVCV